MRPYFSDTDRLRRLAERNLQSGLTRLKRWWSRKYNRPPTDQMFVTQTPADLELEMLEDLIFQRDEIMRKLNPEKEEDGVYEPGERAHLRKQLSSINDALGVEPDLGDDPLIDAWERELEAGRMPDFSRTTTVE